HRAWPGTMSGLSVAGVVSGAGPRRPGRKYVRFDVSKRRGSARLAVRARATGKVDPCQSGAGARPGSRGGSDPAEPPGRPLEGRRSEEGGSGVGFLVCADGPLLRNRGASGAAGGSATPFL